MSKKIQRKIKPGQPGTKQLVKKYGEKLLCVRYIYDPEEEMKYKTVELVEKADSWEPDEDRIPPNKTMHIKVEYGEKKIGKLVRSAGGEWNRKEKYWELPYREVKALGLEDRIIDD